MASSPPDSQTGVQASSGLLSRIASEFSFIRGNFLLLTVSWLFMDFASEMPATYYGKYVEALGGSAATVGLIGFASMASQALVQFPGGYLADKYGRRWLISTMTFGVALSYAFYAFAPNWQTIMVGAVVSSLCMIYSPALTAIIMDSLPPERRGMGFSIINLIASVSTTPAPLIAGWLLTKYGLVPSMRMGYTFVVAMYLAAAVLRLRLKETLKGTRRINGRELLRNYPRSIVESVRVWKVVPRSAFILFVAGFVTMFSFSLFQPVLLFWVLDDLGISEVSWAFILTVLFISMIVLAIPCGKLIDKIGKKKPLLLAYLLLFLLVPLFIKGDFYKLLFAMPMVGMMQILFNAASSALNADLVPQEHRGKVVGSSRFFTLVAASLGQLTGGFMYDNVSHSMPFLIQVVFILPSLLLTLFLIKEPKKKEE